MPTHLREIKVSNEVIVDYSGGLYSGPLTEISSSEEARLVESDTQPNPTSVTTQLVGPGNTPWRPPTSWSGSNRQKQWLRGERQLKSKLSGGNVRTETRKEYPPTSMDITTGVNSNESMLVKDGFTILDTPMIKNGSIQPVGLNLQNRVITEARSKLRDSDIDLSVTFGELPSAIRMLAARTLPFFKAALAAKKGQWNKIPKIMGFDLKNLKRYTNFTTWAQLYIEFRFGWDATFADLYEIHKHTSRVIQKARISRGNASVVQTSRSSGVFNGQYLWELECRRSVRSVIYAITVNERAQQLARLGLVSPASVVWELVPWSFVIDWFLPVGKMIEAASANWGQQFLGGSWSCKTEFTKTVTEIGAGSYNIVEPRKLIVTDETYERTKFNSMPMWRPYLKSPVGKRHGLRAREDIAGALAIQQINNLLRTKLK